MQNCVQTFLEEMVSSKKVSGCCCAVWQNGAPLFIGYEGYSDLRNKIPVSERTAFRLASMTKPVTAAAVLLCAERGLLELDSPIYRYLPAFERMYLARSDSKGDFSRGELIKTPVTLLHLLTHSSGLGSGEARGQLYESVQPREGDTLASAVDRYAGVPLEFIPGTAQAYSPVMAFDVLARAVEVASGTQYGEFVRKNIFEPVGMRATSYSLSDFSKEEIAVTYIEQNGVLTGESPETNFGEFPQNYTGGGAGLISTLDDYCKFAEAIRKSERGEGLLTPDSFAAMKKPWLQNIAGVSEYFNWGLGVRSLAASCDWQKLTGGSFGWSGAYGTHFWIDPVRKVTAVYMHNSNTYGGAGAPHTVEFEKRVYRFLN